jgi:hypothetical protein
MSEAMVFDDYLKASKFRDMLSDVCKGKFSINKFIN